VLGADHPIIYDRISHEAYVLAASVFFRRFSPKYLTYNLPFSACLTTRCTVSDLWAKLVPRAFLSPIFFEKNPYKFDLFAKLKVPLSGSVQSIYDGYREVI
jgi:hypothetical protein